MPTVNRNIRERMQRRGAIDPNAHTVKNASAMRVFREYTDRIEGNPGEMIGFHKTVTAAPVDFQPRAGTAVTAPSRGQGRFDAGDTRSHWGFDRRTLYATVPPRREN